MGVFKESWCFCNGGGKSERLKAAIFTGKGPAMARILAAGEFSGTGFLIHRNLLLTTHAIIPSVASAEAAQIRLHSGLAASLFPHRFFITSSVLDLTIVGLDAIDGESSSLTQQPHYLKTCSKPNLDLGSAVYLLGFAEKKELAVGEGKVVIATDNLIKMSTDGVTWSPGSSGFDIHGNLSFMVCDPMKLATSPNTKSSSNSSSSSSSWKKDLPMQFGIPIPIICDWLNQHWEGNLDDLNKPKLPIIRLMSTGQRSEHSCASFTMRRVFKATEAENDAITPSSSNLVTKCNDQPGSSSSPVANNCEDENIVADQPATAHLQGIPTPEIYESPKLTSIPFRRKENNPIQLLDINFPPRMVKPAVSPNPARKKDLPLQQTLREEERLDDTDDSAAIAEAEIASTGSADGAHSEVHSSSSPVEVLPQQQHDYSSDGEITMYSAETAESRNYPSPKEGRLQQQVGIGRSQSCVNYNRWAPALRNSNPVARRPMLEKQRSFMQGRKVYSQGATSQRSNDYFSPTVSSIMKKRNSLEQPSKRNSLELPVKPRPSAVHSSPKWAF